MAEAYQKRYDHNQKCSAISEERLGDLFFDWWEEIWCKNSSKLYSVKELQDELKIKFPYHIVVDKKEKSIESLKECMTSEWTSYTWDNKLYAYFKTEEDKVKFILFST